MSARLVGASPPSSKARCYLATELATMGDLFTQLKKQEALKERDVRDVVLQLVMAVAGLHRNNICHRDIKPENILLERSRLNPRGVVLLVSFFFWSPHLRIVNICSAPSYCIPIKKVSYPLAIPKSPFDLKRLESRWDQDHCCSCEKVKPNIRARFAPLVLVVSIGSV